MNSGIPGFPVAPWALHLDELVIVKRPGCFGGDRLSEAGVTQADQGLQVVGQATQVAALLLGELRGYRRCSNGFVLSAVRLLRGLGGVPPARTRLRL